MSLRPRRAPQELWADAAAGLRVLLLDATKAEARALHRRLAPFVLLEVDGGRLLNMEARSRYSRSPALPNSRTPNS